MLLIKLRFVADQGQILSSKKNVPFDPRLLYFKG